MCLVVVLLLVDLAMGFLCKNLSLRLSWSWFQPMWRRRSAMFCGVRKMMKNYRKRSKEIWLNVMQSNVRECYVCNVM